MDSDTPNSKTGLTRSQELDIVMQAIKAYANKYKIDPAEISDLFSEGCDDYTFPEFNCPLLAIEIGVNILKQGKAMIREQPIIDHSNRIKYLHVLKKAIKVELSGISQNKKFDIDETLDRLNQVSIEIEKLETK